MIAKFMQTKKGVANFEYSEPEFLISTMDRHQDWAVIICLVGGGQEINTGEAGLPEWFDSLRRAFPHWDVYITPQLNDEEYRREREWGDMISDLNIFENENLHLATSVRSFRTPDLAAFVKAVLDVDTNAAKELYARIKDKYPIVLTRDLNKAKEWVRSQCQGTTRYGLLASSGALRLKPEGIFVKNEISVANWFLNGKDDVRSSYYLEDVVSEFDMVGMGLEGVDVDLQPSSQIAKERQIASLGDRKAIIYKDEEALTALSEDLGGYDVYTVREAKGMEFETVLVIPNGMTDNELYVAYTRALNRLFLLDV